MYSNINALCSHWVYLRSHTRKCTEHNFFLGPPFQKGLRVTRTVWHDLTLSFDYIHRRINRNPLWKATYGPEELITLLQWTLWSWFIRHFVISWSNKNTKSWDQQNYYVIQYKLDIKRFNITKYLIIITVFSSPNEISCFVLYCL